MLSNLLLISTSYL